MRVGESTPPEPQFYYGKSEPDHFPESLAISFRSRANAGIQQLQAYIQIAFAKTRGAPINKNAAVEVETNSLIGFGGVDPWQIVDPDADNPAKFLPKRFVGISGSARTHLLGLNWKGQKIFCREQTELIRFFNDQQIAVEKTYGFRGNNLLGLYQGQRLV